MALRQRAVGMVEASRQFRRVNGHRQLPALRTALQRHLAERHSSSACQEDTVYAA